MSFLNFFKKKDTKAAPPVPTPAAISRPEPDPRYPTKVAEGTVFEHNIITFEERKKTVIPSAHGLYPAEILLLDYCSRGTYPNPKSGYPRCWWFSYGIRDVNAVLASLEERGFITLGSVKDAIPGFTIPQLKGILVAHEQATSGKKADLVVRVSQTVTDEELLAAGAQQKYALTELGRQELDENAYVPYMHTNRNKTTEDSRFGILFNVWTINQLLGTGDKSNWRAIVGEQEEKLKQERAERHKAYVQWLKENDPEGYQELLEEDRRREAVRQAEENYAATNDLYAYIAFWEKFWSKGFKGFVNWDWYFELPEAYIKAERYDDALVFLGSIKAIEPRYAPKVDTYIKKIQKLKAKDK